MSIYITSINPATIRELGLEIPENSTRISQSQGGSAGAVPFANILRDMVGETNEALTHADDVSTSFARGQQNDLHGTMLALSQANIRLQLVNETRNHLLDAYREVMRMNV